MKGIKSLRGRKKRRKGDTDQLAAQLAPLEEQDKPAAEQQLGAPITSAPPAADRHFGTIIVDNDDWRISTDIGEPQQEKHILGMEPVVLVVLIVLLGFIAFITWQISLMPPQ